MPRRIDGTAGNVRSHINFEAHFTGLPGRPVDALVEAAHGRSQDRAERHQGGEEQEPG